MSEASAQLGQPGRDVEGGPGVEGGQRTGQPPFRRSFIAVPLPTRVQAAIFEAAQSLAGRLPEVKWSRKVANLHVTLRFLGAIAEPLLARYAASLAEVAGALPAFRLGLRGFGAFPSVDEANVIWAGVDDRSGGLGRLAAAARQVAERLGDGAPEASGRRPRAPVRSRPSRPFHGHVTVGRTSGRASRRGIDARAALAPFAERGWGEVSVDEVHLYESILGGDGSTYVLRGTATLEGATDGDDVR
jgi:2'-5' RNA ligase